MANNTTSTNESNEGSLTGVLNTVLDKFQRNLQVMLPCMVTKVDRDKNKVSVIPLIRILLADGTTAKRSQVFNVPISNYSAGGFIINFPVKVGDYGYIKTCDRDITLFKQGWNEAKPNTLRKNSFEDSVYVPDVINPSEYEIAGEDADNLVIQSFDNSVKITLSEDSIKMKAPTKITLESETIEQIATNHIVTNGTMKHDGVSIDKYHVHLQNNGNDAGGGIDTTVPSN